MGTVVDLSDRKFGRLTVIRQKGTNKHGQALWECQCECGNTHVVTGSSLKVGNVKSCGCLKKEARIGKCDRGDSKTLLYRRWSQIKNLCTNPSNAQWHLYGGKGIKVCEAWMEFSAFKEWMLAQGYEDGMFLSRKDKSKDYEPDNCIITKERIPNSTSRTFVTYNGETRSLTEWAEVTGISYNTLKWRYNHGRTGDSLFMDEKHIKLKQESDVPDSESADVPESA